MSHNPEAALALSRAAAANGRAKWARVEFHGLMPPGQVLTGIDPLELGANLMKAFGFTHIDGLTVVAVEDPE